MDQSTDRRFGFFIIKDPAHCKPIKAACSLAVWVHHTAQGPLLCFVYCDQFRDVTDDANTYCYEWEVGPDGQAKAIHVPSLESGLTDLPLPPRPTSA